MNLLTYSNCLYTEFQLLHAPATFRAERIAWRAVIYLNLVRSVRRYVNLTIAHSQRFMFDSILDALTPESDVVDDHDDTDSLETASVIITSNGRPPSAISGTRVPNYEFYRTRLQPLVELEERLIRLLSCPDEDEATRLGPPHPTWSNSTFVRPPINGTNGRPAPMITIPTIPEVHSSYSSPNHSEQPSPSKSSKAEVAVHTSTNWKKAFALGGKAKSPKNAHSGEIEGWWEDPEDPVHPLNACASTMQELWRDQNVRKRLQEKRIRLEESSGL